MTWVVFFIEISNKHAEIQEGEIVVAKILMVIALVRLVRLIDFLKELKVWLNLVKALDVLSGPFFALSITLWYIYMIYASLGVLWFGGKVNEDNFPLLV
jgi:predicted nucleic acid-binding protein